MGMLDRISSFFTQTGRTLTGMAKIVLLSRPHSIRRLAGPDEEIVILGNGPSLNTTVAESMPFLRQRHKLAVNFAANTPLFADLKPDFYVLADPHFFVADADNVISLWDTLRHKVDWPMTLFVPTRIRSPRIESLHDNPCIIVRRYNTTPVEGFRLFRHAVYRIGLGMPRPRNVLIPSLMLALNSGFHTIYLAGADHSWTQTLSVDDENHVVSVQPHFYKDDQKEKTRINTEYTNYPLHAIIYSFYIAFRAYYYIRDYATTLHATVLNITPGSFIDAFPRRKV